MKKTFCYSAIATIIVTVACQNSCIGQGFTAQINLNYFNSQCENNAVFMDAVPNDTSLYDYNWTCPGGNCPSLWNVNGASASFWSDFNQLALEPYTVLITERSTGDTSSATVLVQIYPDPVGGYSNNSGFGCEGQQIVIYPASNNPSYGPYTYTWNYNVQPVDADSFIYDFGPGNGLVPDLKITNAYGCFATNSNALWMFGSPTPQVSLSANGATTFCFGGNVSLTASASHFSHNISPVSYSWKKNGIIQPGSDSVFSATRTGQYRCVVTSAGGCSATSSAIPVTTWALPAISVSPSVQTSYCYGQPAELVASSPTAVSFSWKRYGASYGGINDTILISQPGKYKAVAHDANGCTRASSPVNVTGPPSNQVNVTGSLTFCSGDSVILTAAPGFTYQWRKYGNNIPAPAGIGQFYIAKTPGKYKVLVTNNSNCTVSSPTFTVSTPCRLGGVSAEIYDKVWEMYPNPFQENLNIRIPYFLESTCMVALYDLSGRLVLESEIMATDDSEMELFTGDLQNGMYLLQIRTGEEVIKQVVVKQ